METLNFAIPTLFGLEALAADELRRLGLDQVRAENGRVLCSGRPGDIPRMDLNLRTGERVLLVLGTFPAGDFDALFEGTRALAWEQFIPREGQFPVKGHCLNSALHSVPACQSIVKKAAAARLGDAYGLNTLPETGALFQIQFSIMKDTAVLMLDTSGPGLYKRGYRAHGVDAPLRETLAAAMVLLSRYRGRDPLCDPFCGSGTIPIEAALIAKNRAPGLNRSFSAQKWSWLDKKLQREQALLLVQLWQLLLRDLMMCKLQLYDRIYNIDLLDELKSQSSGWQLSALKQALVIVQEAYDALVSSVGMKTALETMALKIDKIYKE